MTVLKGVMLSCHPLPFQDPVDLDDAWVTRALEFYADNPPEAVQRAHDEAGHQNTTPGRAPSPGKGVKGKRRQGSHQVPAWASSSDEDYSDGPVTPPGPVDHSHLLRAATSDRALAAVGSSPSADDDSDWLP